MPDHPDRHFPPCQLMGLASPDSCQAPAAGEQSPVTAATAGRQASSDFRRACELRRGPRPGCGLSPARSMPGPLRQGPREPALGCEVRPARTLSLPLVFVLGAGSPGGPCERFLSSATHPLSGCTPSSWNARDQAASACRAVGGAAGMAEGGEAQPGREAA